MKRIFGISLFFFLIGPYLGMFSWLHVQKKIVRKEVKRKLIAGLDKSQLVYFQFSKNDAESELEWVHSKEFQYKGQMYDIVESTCNEDSVYYYCWWDNEETELNKKLDTLLAGIWEKNKSTKQQHKKLTSFFKSLYFYSLLHQNSFIRIFSSKENIHPIFINYKSFVISPQGPPPRFV